MNRKNIRKKKFVPIILMVLFIIIILAYIGVISGRTQHIALSVLAGVTLIGAEISGFSEGMDVRKKILSFVFTIILVLAAIYVAVTI